MHLRGIIDFQVHFLGLCQVVVMVLLHLLLYHLELLKFVEVCQLLLISLDSFIEAVDLDFLFAVDINVMIRVIEILCVAMGVLARVLLLSHSWGTLISRRLLFLFGLKLDLVLAHLLDKSIEVLTQLQLFLRHVDEGEVF